MHLPNPKVSVLLPLYNAEKFIVSALESVLNQTFKDFEVLVIDDGSRDRGYTVVQEYVRIRGDSRVVFLQNEKNSGLSFTLNRGIQAARGEYLARMDADDLCTPDRLEKQVHFLNSHPDIDIVGTGLETFGRTFPKLILNPATDLEIKLALLFDCALTLVMMRKEKILQLDHFYDSYFNGAEDFEFWIRCAQKFKFSNVMEALFFYRIHKTQETSARKNITQARANEAREKYLDQLQIKLSENQLRTHHLVATYSLNQVSGEALSDWKKAITSALENSMPECVPVFNQVLATRFTRVYLGNFYHRKLKHWIQQNGLLNLKLLSGKEKLFLFAKASHRWITGRSRA